MRIVVGPVSSTSVQAWVAYAREVVDEFRDSDDVWCYTDPLVLEAFDAYLVEWTAIAARGDRFRWETEVPKDEAEYRIHAFHQIAELLAERAETWGRQSPTEGDEFYRALVSGILHGLSEVDDPMGEQLAVLWPGTIVD